jgi:hypothetical protein
MMHQFAPQRFLELAAFYRGFPVREDANGHNTAIAQSLPQKGIALGMVA